MKNKEYIYKPKKLEKLKKQFDKKLTEQTIFQKVAKKLLFSKE